MTTPGSYEPVRNPQPIEVRMERLHPTTIPLADLRAGDLLLVNGCPVRLPDEVTVLR